MESHFTTGIIIGIIIGVVGVKIFAPTETPAVSSSEPQVQTKTVVVPRYVNTYYDDDYSGGDGWDNDFDYSSVGFHEHIRGR